LIPSSSLATSRGRRFLLQNPSSYVGFAGSTMTEVQFLNELVDRTLSVDHLIARRLGLTRL